jgi:hypothetical protein
MSLISHSTVFPLYRTQRKKIGLRDWRLSFHMAKKILKIITKTSAFLLTLLTNEDQYLLLRNSDDKACIILLAKERYTDSTACILLLYWKYV